MAKFVKFSRKDSKYYASIDGKEFLVGRRVTYLGNIGLDNLAVQDGVSYDPASHQKYGFWAHFLAPTVRMEGQGAMTTLNTYDRARFTYGFMQYAAHVPDGDFVRWFREALATSEAAEYFPDLALGSNGRIHLRSATALKPLEDSGSTAGLMDYLNPTLADVEDAEIVSAAKFIHWTLMVPSFAESQVAFAIDHIKSAMRQYALKYNLDGKSDAICSVVFDIRHQGRGSSADIIAALNASDPLSALLKVGPSRYQERGIKLGKYLRDQIKAGIFNRNVYDAKSADFVPVPTA